jgi:inosose dehydratase
MDVQIGCGQITWGADVAPDQVLADIAQAGYAGAPWSASAGETPEQVRQRFDRAGLVPAPGYFGGDFWDTKARADHLERARRHAGTAAALGLTEMYVAVGGFDRKAPSGRTRRQTAGHASPDEALTDDEFGRLTEGLDAIGRISLEEGVRSCFHNHVGTFIETEDEIERLLAAVDADVLFLGPDTGHLAWAGVDVPAFTRRHAERIKTMHLKDVVAEVAEQGREGAWDYDTTQFEGVWTEIGEGDVDFAATLAALEQASFSGWLIVETDVTQKDSALESATICRQNLRALGV